MKVSYDKFTLAKIRKQIARHLYYSIGLSIDCIAEVLHLSIPQIYRYIKDTK